MVSTAGDDEIDEITAHGNEVYEVTAHGNVVWQAGPDAPPITDGLVHHYDASDFTSNESVSLWEDHVSGNHLEPVSSEPTAIPNEIDGEHTVVYCVDDYMEGQGHSLSWPFSIFVVAKKWGDDRHYLINHEGSGAGGSTHIGQWVEDEFGSIYSDGASMGGLTTAAGSVSYPSQTGEFYFFGGVYDHDGSEAAVYRFMQHESTGSIDHRTHEGISLGADTGYPGMDQEYAVILAYDRRLDSSERQTLYEHYRDYYNLTEQ